MPELRLQHAGMGGVVSALQQRVPRVRGVGARAGRGAGRVDVRRLRRACAAPRTRAATLLSHVPCSTLIDFL